MQAVSHFDLVVRHSGVEASVCPVFLEFVGKGDGSDCLHESQEGKIRVLLGLSSSDQFRFSLFVLGNHVFSVFPDQEEGVSNILISRSTELIHYAMGNISNLINKQHNTFL